MVLCAIQVANHPLDQEGQISVVAQCSESQSGDPVVLFLGVDHLLPEIQEFPHLLPFLEANLSAKLRLVTYQVHYLRETVYFAMTVPRADGSPVKALFSPQLLVVHQWLPQIPVVRLIREDDRFKISEEDRLTQSPYMYPVKDLPIVHHFPAHNLVVDLAHIVVSPTIPPYHQTLYRHRHRPI